MWSKHEVPLAHYRQAKLSCDPGVLTSLRLVLDFSEHPQLVSLIACTSQGWLQQTSTLAQPLSAATAARVQQAASEMMLAARIMDVRTSQAVLHSHAWRQKLMLSAGSSPQAVKLSKIPGLGAQLQQITPIVATMTDCAILALVNQTQSSQSPCQAPELRTDI